MSKKTLSRTLLNSLIGYKIEQAREMQAIALSGTSKSEAVGLLKDVDTDLRGILLLDIDPGITLCEEAPRKLCEAINTNLDLLYKARRGRLDQGALV